MSFAAITLSVSSQRVFIVVSLYFVIDLVRKGLVTPSYFPLTYNLLRSTHAFLSTLLPDSCSLFFFPMRSRFTPVQNSRRSVSSYRRYHT
jgi:hypothetical protein